MKLFQGNETQSRRSGKISCAFPTSKRSDSRPTMLVRVNRTIHMQESELNPFINAEAEGTNLTDGLHSRDWEGNHWKSVSMVVPPPAARIRVLRSTRLQYVVGSSTTSSSTQPSPPWWSLDLTVSAFPPLFVWLRIGLFSFFFLSPIQSKEF